MRKAEKVLFSLILLLLFGSLCLSYNVYGATSVTLYSAGQTETTITLSWTKSDDWFFSNYEVTYAAHVNGPYTTLATITEKDTTVYAVTGLNPATDYYFVVKDTGTAVGTTPSNTLQVTTRHNPTISVTSRTQTTVSLKWNDYNIYSEEVPFNSYVIQMSIGGGQWSTLTTMSDVTQNTYTVTGLSPATTYSFRMYDKVGASGQYTSTSNVRTVTTDSTPTPQPTPQDSDGSPDGGDSTTGDLIIPIEYIAVVTVIIIVLIVAVLGLVIRQNRGKNKPTT